MTAPRTCRSCGAPLPGDVRWCLRCYAPALELTPRERQLPPLDRVEPPPPNVPRSPLRDDAGPPPVFSRWRAGPTTFGPVGRLAVTALLMLPFPWDALVSLNPLRLWFMLAYTMFLAYALRDVWRKERVMDVRPARTGRARGLRAALGSRSGPLNRPVDARLLVPIVVLAVAAALAIAWGALDRVGRFGLVAVGVVGTGALLWAWWSES
jgi:hypothetical protein